MGKVEQLANIAGQLSEEQLDGVIAYAAYLSGPSFYETAPIETLAAIDRGLADAQSGRTKSLDQVRREIDAIIAGKR